MKICDSPLITTSYAAISNAEKLIPQTVSYTDKSGDNRQEYSQCRD